MQAQEFQSDLNWITQNIITPSYLPETFTCKQLSVPEHLLVWECSPDDLWIAEEE